tara:strand:+ start:580 stop:840 length:261 start_codon:yes stop_codon:yes gene_type:complete
MDTFSSKLQSLNAEHKEMIPLLYDILRTITIQVVAQFMYVMNNPNESFLTSNFILTTLFICLGIMVFWLIIFKVISDFLYREEKTN